MDKQTLARIEAQALDNRYDIKVKVNAAGETLVTLTSKTTGNVFEGKTSARSSDGYGRALDVAVNRMLSYETRLR